MPRSYAGFESWQASDDSWAQDIREKLSFYVREQSSNLRRVALAARHLRGPLQVIDGTSYAKLVPLLWGKQTAIGELIGAIHEESRLPISVTFEDLDELEESS